MFAQKFNQNYYLCRSRGKQGRELILSKSPIYSWFLVKSKNYGNSGYIPVRKQIWFPKELIGKKVRLSVDVLCDCGSKLIPRMNGWFCPNKNCKLNKPKRVKRLR